MLIKTSNSVNWLSDSSTKDSRGIWKHNPHKGIEFFTEIMKAHLPIEVLHFMQTLLQNNSWKNIKESVGILLGINVVKKHIPVEVIIQAGSNNNEFLNLTHTI